jgi:glutaminase
MVDNLLSDHLSQFMALDTSFTLDELKETLWKQGIQKTDPRLQRFIASAEIHEALDPRELEKDTCLIESLGLVKCAVEGRLAVPEFEAFTKRITQLYHQVLPNTKGEVADYIPQLSRVNPEHFGISICTVDGQRFSIGDTERHFALQSVSKTINYAIALELNGEQKVHEHVGREPSGLAFNNLSLNKNNLPHNPMINAGAMMCCSLIKPYHSMHDRLGLVMKTWQRMMGGAHPIYNDQMFKSEKKTADRNFALFYFMREHKAFAERFNLDKVVDFYFKCCSIEVKCSELAIAASTLANSGVCPFTSDRIFDDHTVKDVVSLMSTCGMYDFSGEYFFKVGIPTKSGVSGALMLVIPNVMGITIWSPRLDSFGNSVRGIEFCEQLVKLYNLHTFDGIQRHATKLDPRRDGKQAMIEKAALLCSAASCNDVIELRRLLTLGIDVNAQNCDGRTALHLAVAEENEDALKFLLAHGADKTLKDRWGNVAIDS